MEEILIVKSNFRILTEPIGALEGRGVMEL